jgi:transcriptional regulator with XRE-family HTH domain
MSLPKEHFGAAVREVLERHNLTLRGQRMRTGLNHVTVGGMAQGIVPSMETVIAFAKGFSLDVNEWLVLAGYEPINPAPAATIREGLERLVESGRAKYPEPEYASEEEAGPIMQFTGQTDIPDHDRALLEEAFRILEAEHKAKHRN